MTRKSTIVKILNRWGTTPEALLQERQPSAGQGCGHWSESAGWNCTRKQGHEGPHASVLSSEGTSRNYFRHRGKVLVAVWGRPPDFFTLLAEARRQRRQRRSAR